MKKLIILWVLNVAVVILFSSCASVDKLAEEYNIEKMKDQVVELVEEDMKDKELNHFNLEFKGKDRYFELTMKKNPEVVLEIQTPKPIYISFWEWLKRAYQPAVKFDGTYEEEKFSKDQQETIQEACEPLISEKQKELIEKNYKKYHQVKDE